MKKLIIIPCLFICLSISAATYYVATDGDDGNPGTLAQPWATWGKGVQTAVAGDTVYIRGGVYYKQNATSYTVLNSGTAENHIVFINYPDETPILDCGNYRPVTEYNEVIVTNDKSYIDFIGLTVRNVLQLGGDYGVNIKGFHFYKGTEVRAIRCIAYNVSGIGFMSSFNNNDGKHYFINCDAYNIIDTLSAPGYVAGRGTGFRSYTYSGSSLGTTYFQSCRAWNCSDQGFSLSLDAVSIADNCWSFNNGYDEGDSGDGHGFKLGWATVASEVVKRRVTNCIAAYNDWAGFTTNDKNYPNVAYMNIYNNTAYKNGNGRFGAAYGFWIYNPNGDDEDELERVYKNNISYANQTAEVGVGSGALYSHSNNSWDIPITLTDNDFVSLDSTGLTGARQADGSLPVLDFLKLSSTSAAIDAGTDVGLDYNNAAPDLGAYEYPTFDEAVVPYLNTTYPTFSWSMGITSGGNMLDAGGGTISRKGVCYSTSVDPTTSDNVVEGGTGTSDFTSKIWALKPNTTYHVRAFATNEYGTGYGADVTFTTPIRSFGVKNKKIIKLNGKIVII